MTARYQQRSPEEIELERKRSELASLRAKRAGVAAVLHDLREEVAGFERSYQETLGRRMAELERLEEEIASLSVGDVPRTEKASAQEREEYLDTETYNSGKSFRPGGSATKARVWKSNPQDIKALYREVAKAIHPDLAGDEPGSAVRHELMLKANKAYAEEDSGTLQEILRSWKRDVPTGGETEADGARAELERVKRQIAAEAEALRDLQAKLEELRASYVCRFKLRVEQGLAAGSDLFADMIAAAEINIARAQRRVATLREERARSAKGTGTRQKRVLPFPTGTSCGSLFVRELNSANFNQWKPAGPAIGRVEVYLDQAVRLDVKDDAEKLKFLQELKGDDLQALYLYEVCDADLDHIVHLAGLEELYLCGPQLTDAALLSISSLTNLKRIYLYQTSVSDRGLMYLHCLQGLTGLTSSGNSITDEGLAIFQKAIPGVKTVSFKWRR